MDGMKRLRLLQAIIAAPEAGAAGGRDRSMCQANNFDERKICA